MPKSKGGDIYTKEVQREASAVTKQAFEKFKQRLGTKNLALLSEAALTALIVSWASVWLFKTSILDSSSPGWLLPDSTIVQELDGGIPSGSQEVRSSKGTIRPLYAMATTTSPILMDPDRVFPKLPDLIVLDHYYIGISSDDEKWFSEHSKNADWDRGFVATMYFVRARPNVERVMRLANERLPLMDDATIRGIPPDDPDDSSFLATVFQRHEMVLNRLHDPCLQDRNGSLERYNIVIDKMRLYSKSAEETESERLQDGSPKLRIEFRWLEDLHRSMEDAISLLIATYRFGMRHFQDPDQRHKSNRLVERAYNMIPEMTRLMVDLLDREADFEGMYSKEHVCDLLMNKRLRCVNFELASQYGMHWAREVTLQRTPYLKKEVAKYSMLMRNRFAYRYYEWVAGRLWKKLYLVYGEDIGAGTIAEFMNFASTTTPLARVMLGVHPLPQANLRAGEVCGICLESYQPYDLVMELRNCPHRFHAWCVIKHFDQHHRHDNTCPTCRTSAGTMHDFWNIRTRDAELDKCYGQDPGARPEADLNDHYIRHWQRRSWDVVYWPPPFQKYFFERERLAWLDGATVADRIALFPDVVNYDEDSGSEDGCSWDQPGAGNDEEGDDEEAADDGEL